MDRRDFLKSIAGAAFLESEPAEAQGTRINLPPYSLEQAREAVKFADTFINPVLVKHATSTQELQSVKDRIMDIVNRRNEKKLLYTPVPVKYPYEESVLAKVDYDPQTKLWRLLAFIPNIQDDKRKFDSGPKPREFEDYVVFNFCHEDIHLTLLDKNQQYADNTKAGYPNRKLAQQEESEAWGRTILEISRPMETARRYVPKNFSDASKLLKQFGDNYHDPRWIAAFENFHKIEQHKK